MYLKCKNCVYHKGTADMDTIESTCKRLDHKHLQFAVPWFRSYDCDGRICADFKPSPLYAYCYRLWHDRYIRFYRPKDERDTIGLVVDKNTSVRYYVKYQDFFDNTFLNEDGGLKWLYKSYYIETRLSPFGYMLINEYPDGSIERNGTAERFKNRTELLKHIRMERKARYEGERA